MKLSLAILALWGLIGAMGDSELQASVTAPTAAQMDDLATQEQQLARQLLQDFSESEKALVLLGDFYQQRGKTDLALDHWQQALQRNPKAAQVYDRMAKLAFETDDWEESTRLWQKAVQINPSLSNLHNSLARSLMQLGRYEEAKQAVEQELQVSSDNAPSYTLLGAVHLELRNYEEAKQSYKKILDLDPNAMHAYYGLYQVCSRLKDHNAARTNLAEFQRRKTQWRKAKQQTVVRNLGRSDSETGFHARCLAQLCANAQQLYRANGDQKIVEQLLNRAIELAPQSISHRTRLMSFYVAADRIPEALQVCKGIKGQDPDNLSCQLNLGRLAARLNQFAAAEGAFQEAIRMAPEHAHGYRELARLYLGIQGKQLDARTLAVKAVELEPSARHYFLLGWAYDVTGQRARAIEALQQAVARAPQNQTYQTALQRIAPEEARK